MSAGAEVDGEIAVVSARGPEKTLHRWFCAELAADRKLLLARVSGKIVVSVADAEYRRDPEQIARSVWLLSEKDAARAAR